MKGQDPFLDAWKAVVLIIGPELFGPGDPLTAISKNELRPLKDVVDNAFGTMSHGERRFLCAALSFYNSRWADQLAERAGNGRTICDLLCDLDGDWQGIIFRLVRTYRGW